MRVLVRVDGGSPADVESLRQWLAGERTVKAHGELAWAPGDRSGEMGLVIDILTLVLGNGLSALQLALAVAQWRQSRHAAPAVTISRTDPSGVTVRIEASTPESLAQAVRELEEP